MVMGEFMYRDRAGNVTPLIYQELQQVLLRNCEQFITGKITALDYQEVYNSCVEIESEVRRLNQEVPCECISSVVSVK